MNILLLINLYLFSKSFFIINYFDYDFLVVIKKSFTVNKIYKIIRVFKKKNNSVFESIDIKFKILRI